MRLPLADRAALHVEMFSVFDVASVMHSVKTLYCTHLHTDPAAYDALVAGLPTEWEQYHTTYTFHLALAQRS